MAISNNRASNGPPGSPFDFGRFAPAFPTVVWSGAVPHALPVARAGLKETRAPSEAGLFRVVLLRGRRIVGLCLAVARVSLALEDRDGHENLVSHRQPK